LTEELLRLEDVTCYDRNGVSLVSGVSFALKAGRTIWVTGPAGCGKTTLVEAILKVRRVDLGNIYLNTQPLWGKDSISKRVLRRRIGVIFQNDLLLDDQTVFENAAVALRISGHSGVQVHDRTYQALRDVGLTHKAEQDIAALSSSERRLLALARVLAKMPALVVADLNSCDVDQRVIAPRLETLATYGCGVLIFSKQHSPALKAASQSAELVLE
jgi:ABC-type ATPase involved in cell division